MEYSYMSKSSNKIAARLSVLFFGAGGIILAAVSVFSVPFTGAFQFLSALFFTLAVLLLTRYVFKSFLIRIVENGNEGHDLTITECRGKDGKDRATVCRISLANVERVVVRTEENKAALSGEEKGRKVFCYSPDINPERECFVFVTECGEPMLLKFSPDDAILSVLKKYANSAQNDLQ